MDYLTLNALGITVMAVFGLWVFYHVARNAKKGDPQRKEDRKDDHKDDHKDDEPRP